MRLQPVFRSLSVSQRLSCLGSLRCASQATSAVPVTTRSRAHAEPERSEQQAWRFLLAGVAGATALTLLPAPAQCYFSDREDGSVDRLSRWSSRSWALPAGRSPGFHLKTVNPLLEKHLSRWSEGVSSAQEGAPLKVLVPLCGKSFDMPYLCENGHAVVGVEGVARPIFEFKEAHRMLVKGMKDKTVLSKDAAGWTEGVAFQPADQFQGSRPGQAFKKGDKGLGYYTESPAVWRGKVSHGKKSLPLHIIEGDMFEVTPQLVSTASPFVSDGRFELAYDRGALVAIPPESREEYVATMSDLLHVGGRILLVVLDYDQEKLPFDGKKSSPPPFSVTKEHVSKLFPDRYWSVQLLDNQPAVTGPAFKGIDVREKVYLVEKRREGSGKAAKASGSSSAGLWLAGTTALLGVAAVAFLRPGRAS